MTVRSSTRRGRWVSAMALGALLAYGIWWYFGSSEAAAPSYRSAPLERGDVVVTVSATGSLTALSTVDIGSQVSGQVLEVNADLDANPEKVNEDPYSAWLIKIEVGDASQVDGLLTADAYKELIGQ